jgi:hypothetical protein
MQTPLSKCVVLSILVALAGCGSSSSGGGSVARADFASESAKATCHHLYKCCDATELMSDPTWGTTEAECATMQTSTVTTSLMNLLAGVDAGRITYHADRAKQCLDSLTALSCDWGIYYNAHNVTGCAHVFDGTVATGSACTMDEECTSGFCMGGSTCAARGASGDACTAPTACADGLYCPVSAGDHCVAVKKIGEACDVSISCENASCVIPDGQTSGTCGAPMMCNGV